MPNGEMGVGIEAEGRVSLKASGFTPMWPFMEQGLSECLQNLRSAWTARPVAGLPRPESLIEETVRSAWASGRPYWMHLSVSWVTEMVDDLGFDRQIIRDLVVEMLQSDKLTPELRECVIRASSRLARDGEGNS
ncbi:hypothetical protein ACT1U9_18310 [Streptomyces sp. BR1]|uniref:hypothetical protein n=1 Tax=Streptomyces sp. BR1 TaxID=1592323 RepID=UPI00402B764E